MDVPPTVPPNGEDDDVSHAVPIPQPGEGLQGGPEDAQDVHQLDFCLSPLRTGHLKPKPIRTTFVLYLVQPPNSNHKPDQVNQPIEQEFQHMYCPKLFSTPKPRGQ